MFGSFNSSGSCLKKKKRKKEMKEEKGVLLTACIQIWGYFRLHFFWVTAASSWHLPCLLHPLPTIPLTCNSLPMPVSQAPSLPTSRWIFQVFFQTTPFTSWITDAGSKLWENTSETNKQANLLSNGYSLFFCLNLYNLSCLRIIFGTHFGFYIKGPNFALIDIHKNGASK